MVLVPVLVYGSMQYVIMMYGFKPGIIRYTVIIRLGCSGIPFKQRAASRDIECAVSSNVCHGPVTRSEAKQECVCVHRVGTD